MDVRPRRYKHGRDNAFRLVLTKTMMLPAALRTARDDVRDLRLRSQMTGQRDASNYISYFQFSLAIARR